ncbi:hypothetical protein L615_004600000150 [Nocardioides sp. J9]|uniref:DUF6318 family protein n=1 Tax=Nocardioides sp. J9 TaxID=935844 RepID=UPI0011A54CD0|nr:DUF6318 family protein [Nocardioides sp. J9]TWG95920.1 hypothetical protein L615_004600000150 [Nocardioides sp. J9]
MRPLRALAATAVALALMAGCSDDDPAPTEPSSTPTESRPPTASPTPETPEEPALPDAARKATKAGARAFISYYWDLINYAQVTGDVKALKRVSGPTCEGCRRATKAVENLYSDGGHAEGGEYALTIEKVKRLTASGSPPGAEAFIRVRNAEQRIIRGSDVETSAPKTSRFVTYLIWVDGAWRTDILEPR